MSRSTPATGPGSTRALAGAVIGPVAFLGLLLAPLPLEPDAHRLAALFALVIVLWISEVLPIAATALLIAPLLVLLGIVDTTEAFRHYANPLLFLFVGGFFIAEAMNEHGLDRRLARALLLSRWVRGRPMQVRVALMLAGGLLSMWISNTATAAILAPIMLGVLGKTRDRAGTGALLALAYTCSIGGLGSLVGSPPNLITFGLLEGAGHALGFFDWMKIGFPAFALLFAAVLVITRWLYPPSPPKPVGVSDGDADASTSAAPDRDPGFVDELEALFDDVPPRWTRGEKVTAVAFALAVVGWMLPGLTELAAWILGRLAGEAAMVARVTSAAAQTLTRALPSGGVALLAASLLFMVPDGTARPGEPGPRVLTWERAARIDWGIIMLFGGGIALGSALVSTGLAAEIGRGFVAVSGIGGLWTLTAIACLFTIFFTEVCSNTASANMLVPLVIAIAVDLRVSPIPPALAVGLAASCAFMLPIATGPNAVVYGTGRVPQAEMIRAGVWLNLVSAGVVFLVIRTLCPLFGWDELAAS